MNWFRKHGITILLILVFLVGLGFLLYPTIADTWNKYHQSRAIASYADTVAQLDDHTYDEVLRQAEEYNAALAQRGISWKLDEQQLADYEAQLNISGTGIMGYIEIEAINCYLPIYHGTAESVLQIAVGHIEGSSLPVGGAGSHCVLSGHRGLPSAKLFTDLDQLREGDTFVIRTLNETYTYEVDQILIVDPGDLSSLVIEPGQDLCTLVTCTPYGINTHRLLVRGHRVENAAQAKTIRVTADASQIEPAVVAPFVAVPLLLVLLLVLLISGRKKKKKGD